MPKLFVDLVCAAAKRFEVRVGLEVAPQVGEALQRYLASPGTTSDRLRIIEPITHSGDGRSSQAMTEAFEALRQLAVETKRVTVFGFQGPKGDESMAEAIRATHAAAPQAVVFALVGHDHSRVTRQPDDDSPPMGLLLRQNGLDIKSIYIAIK